ncbi:MAG: carbamoyl-phosphate synthase large subunit [Candidatus Dasytiphilus stammeri]
MPKRTDINSILIIGSGPIVIGQACEFDYSGVQACKALKNEGYHVILINSNPATIMTDSNMADVTYIEPIDWKVVRKIIYKERPDAILPTMGGQTALNCVLYLHKHGVLDDFGVKIIGVTINTINKAENRQLFYKTMSKIGIDVAPSIIVHTMEEVLIAQAEKKINFPCIIRPSFTMGGTGGGIAYNTQELIKFCYHGLYLSPIHEIIIDKSLVGWKEYEMEVVRDKKDNFIIVCTLENLDPMGIHTGDSIVVAPAQTLTDKEYQTMRNMSLIILREIGLETGGSNVQFAVNPNNGHIIVVEINPRISRSSALASKATGFPIAQVAAKIAVGYSLDELMNDITNGIIPASFEPTIDYVVTKVPRFNFDKFIGANDRLTTQMKSIGEVMAIGRTFQESIQKALRGLEIGIYGFDSKIDVKEDSQDLMKRIRHELKYAGADRILYIADAFRIGLSLLDIFKLTNIDCWFLVQIQELVTLEAQIKQQGISCLTYNFLYYLKRKGFADAKLAELTNVPECKIRALRDSYNIYPVYKRVDTCAAEFSAKSAYLYSTYEEECEALPTNAHNNKIIILGGGPNRIGQGIEFDYCCVHAAIALRKEGFEIIIVNCNPETVSTDYDISDKLYFESITLEDILGIVRIEQPKGIMIQYGGQTPLKLAYKLSAARVTITGTSSDAIDRAENRERCQNMIKSLGLKQAANATVLTMKKALIKAREIGYPLVIRPSYVLGGRSMEIIYNESDLKIYFKKVTKISKNAPLLIEKFIEDAIEVDVDAICDGENVLIGGIMEHIEQAGIHSGDSACSLPTYTLKPKILNIIREQVRKIAFELSICGLINIQFAIKNNDVYLIEINPRASRTVPFVSKAIGISLAKIASLVMVGKKLREQGFTEEIKPLYFAVKEVVLPFNKFLDFDPILGVEMRSTGEVMGIGRNFALALAKARLSSHSYIKKIGRALLSVNEKDKNRIIDIAIKLQRHGFKLDATPRTAKILKNAGIASRLVPKINNSYSHIQNNFKKGEYDYVINTVFGNQDIEESKIIRRCALQYKVYYDTNLNRSFATVFILGIDPANEIISIQKMHEQTVFFNKKPD